MNKITMGTLDYDEKEEIAVLNAIRSKNLSAGPIIEEFENKMAQRMGKKYGILVNSGQSALDVALVLAKIKLDKNKLKVIVPSTTYASDLWSIINTGNEPILCDINYNFVIDYNKATRYFDICLPVDLCGYPATRFDNRFVVEDACEAVGNSLCNYGDIVCLSFYVSHIITTGCGGMLCLDDEKLIEYARNYIAHGRTYGGDFTKFTDKWVNRFLFDKVGVSYRSTSLEAALGLAQLEKLDKIIYKRKENARYLKKCLDQCPDAQEYLEYPNDDYIEKCSFQFFPMSIKMNHIGLDRNVFLQYLFSKGIDSRVLLSLTNQPIVKDLYGDIEKDYPISEYYNRNGFIIGCHQGLTKENLEYIVEVFNNYLLWG